MTVTIAIPVGPRHVAYLPDALASVRGQTVAVSEIIVINDSGQPLAVDGDNVRVIDTPGGIGPAAGRNIAAGETTSEWLIYLDADDALTPNAIESLLRWQGATSACYVYGDWYALLDDGRVGVVSAQEYERANLMRGSLHVVTALLPTEMVRTIGWEDSPFEDWEFFIKAAVRGYCGTRAPVPILTYRQASGDRRGKWSTTPGAIQAIQAKYRGVTMGNCRGCGGSTANFMTTQGAPEANPNDVVLLYTGGNTGTVTFRNPFADSGRTYRVSRSRQQVPVDTRDVEHLLNTGQFTRAPKLDPAPPPNIAPVIESEVEAVGTGDTEAAKVTRERKR